jgi:hypothetical protein
VLQFEGEIVDMGAVAKCEAEKRKKIPRGSSCDGAFNRPKGVGLVHTLLNSASRTEPKQEGVKAARVGASGSDQEGASPGPASSVEIPETQ